MIALRDLARALDGEVVSEQVLAPARDIASGPVTFAKVDVTSGKHTEYCSLATFTEASREELKGLREGDAASAVGDLSVEPYERAAETRAGLKILTDRVFALRREAANPLPRTGIAYTSGREAAAASWASPASGEGSA